MTELTHFNTEGHAKMVDISGKTSTLRTALAQGIIYMDTKTLVLVENKNLKKGDVLGCAQIAGIMAAKKTAEIIPMCHPVSLSGIDIHFETLTQTPGIRIIAKVTCTGNTGVEMEALTAVSAAALTIYDMCKAAGKDMTISQIQLLKKTGGKSGSYVRKEWK